MFPQKDPSAKDVVHQYIIQTFFQNLLLLRSWLFYFEDIVFSSDEIQALIFFRRSLLKILSHPIIRKIFYEAHRSLYLFLLIWSLKGLVSLHQTPLLTFTVKVCIAFGGLWVCDLWLETRELNSILGFAELFIDIVIGT